MSDQVAVHEVVGDALLELTDGPLFGLMGDANMLYVARFRERGGRFVSAAHEGGAIGMATAWAQATGKTGTATVTSGPGFTNTITNLVEAVKSATPVVVVTGDAPAEPMHLQHADLSALATAVGAGYERVPVPDMTARQMSRAYQRAQAESRPIVVDVPRQHLMATVPQQSIVRPVGESPRVVPSDDELDTAMGLLASAARPLILVGRGAVESGAIPSIRALADRLSAPVATTARAKDAFRGSPDDLGICGTASRPHASGIISDADCVIAFGASLNHYTTAAREMFSSARVVQVDVSSGAFHRYLPIDAGVVGDCRQVAQRMDELLAEAELAPKPAYRERVRRVIEENRDCSRDFTDTSGDGTVDPRAASIALDRVLPVDRNTVSDIGRYLYGAWPYIPASDPRGVAIMGAFGSIGLGLAGAIGMSIARPQQSTVCFVGDGGFMMNPAELATAVRERLPLIVLVFDDGAYGFEWFKLEADGADPNLSRVEWPSIAAVAESMGATTRTVQSLDDIPGLEPVIAQAQGPVVVVVSLDPAVNIVP